MAYTAKDPRPPTAFSVPNINVLYLRETKIWRCGRGGRGGGETFHLKTHAPLGGRVGKKKKLNCATSIQFRFNSDDELTGHQNVILI